MTTGNKFGWWLPFLMLSVTCVCDMPPDESLSIHCYCGLGIRMLVSYQHGWGQREKRNLFTWRTAHNTVSNITPNYHQSATTKYIRDKNSNYYENYTVLDAHVATDGWLTGCCSCQWLNSSQTSGYWLAWKMAWAKTAVSEWAEVSQNSRCVPPLPILLLEVLENWQYVNNTGISFKALTPSVLWCCWLGSRKGIWPVKKLSGGMLARLFCLGWGADLHMAQVMPLPLPLTVSCSSKSRSVLPSWFYLSVASSSR